MDDVLAQAELVVEAEFASGRLTAVPLEGRACLAEWERGGQRVVLHTSTQVPHLVRTTVAGILGLDEHRVRVVAPDVGGGFGQKCVVAREEVLVCVAARAVGAPVEVGGGPRREPAGRLPGPPEPLHRPRRLRRRRPHAGRRRRHRGRRRRLLDAPVHVRRRAADGRDRDARPVPRRALPLPHPRGRHQQGADGALPRRRAAADGARHGAAAAEGGDGSSRSRSTRSACATSPASSRTSARPASRSTRAPTASRSSCARARSTCRPSASASAPRARRAACSASASPCSPSAPATAPRRSRSARWRSRPATTPRSCAWTRRAPCCCRSAPPATARATRRRSPRSPPTGWA